MRYGKLTLSLMLAIVLLLGLRTSLSLNEGAALVASGVKATDTAALTDISIQPFNALTPEVQNSDPEEPSIAMLERYLLPQAEAAAESAKAAEQQDDVTLTELRTYKQELDSKAEKLDQREQSLTEAEDRLRQRITELEQLEASIQQRLEDEKKIKNKKVKRLTAVYEGMKPERAAPVIANMELDTVVKIFLLMDEKRVGKILSFLPPEKAVIISEALTRQISTVK